MPSLTCVMFGHDDLLVRSELRLRCQRCGRLTSGVQIGAPRLDVRYAEPDPQHVELRRVAWVIRPLVGTLRKVNAP